MAYRTLLLRIYREQKDIEKFGMYDVRAGSYIH